MCQCNLTINPFYFEMNISTGTSNTPRGGGNHNFETYWIGGSNISPVTRAKSIQTRRPNNFRSASIISKICTLPDKTLENLAVVW